MNIKKVQLELENMKKIPPLYSFAKSVSHALNVETSEVGEVIYTLLKKAENEEFK